MDVLDPVPRGCVDSRRIDSWQNSEVESKSVEGEELGAVGRSAREARNRGEKRHGNGGERKNGGKAPGTQNKIEI